MAAFDLMEHTTLVVVEDRRKNKAQFDLAYTNIDNEEILTAFDNCSNTTFIHKDLISEGKIQVLKTEENSSIKGIGGTAKGKGPGRIQVCCNLSQVPVPTYKDPFPLR